MRLAEKVKEPVDIFNADRRVGYSRSALLAGVPMMVRCGSVGHRVGLAWNPAYGHAADLVLVQKSRMVRYFPPDEFDRHRPNTMDGQSVLDRDPKNKVIAFQTENAYQWSLPQRTAPVLKEYRYDSETCPTAGWRDR